MPIKYLIMSCQNVMTDLILPKYLIVKRYAFRESVKGLVSPEFLEILRNRVEFHCF